MSVDMVLNKFESKLYTVWPSFLPDFIGLWVKFDSIWGTFLYKEANAIVLLYNLITGGLSFKERGTASVEISHPCHASLSFLHW